MKHFTLIFTFAISALFLLSCKKDKQNPTVELTYPDYAMLKTGNYWVYQLFDIDSAGIASPGSTFDSCYVEKDTLINNQTYYKVVKPKPYSTNEKIFSYQRDSLHYVVNSSGQILFSSQDFTTVFGNDYFLASTTDTICQVIKQMAEKDIEVATPAGTFITMNSKTSFIMYPNWTFAGNPRAKHIRYSENIGIVVETLPFFVSQPWYKERRLVRYHLN